MDGPKDASGRPTVAFGARGILSLELTLEAARRDVHSGNFSVPNPAWRLIGLLASMAAPDGTPLVEGLEDGVVPPTAAERDLMGRIPLDRAAIDKELGVALPDEYLERLMFRSTLTIRGLKSGFTGREAQTIIPNQATVAFDARLVKNQRVDVTDIQKLPTIVVPYANANNRQHSPNEHLRLDHLYQGVLTTARLLPDLG